MGNRIRHVDLSTAKRAVAELGEQARQHRKVCNTCYRYHPNAARYCPDGYELAEQLAVAKDDVRRLTPADPGPQGELF